MIYQKMMHTIQPRSLRRLMTYQTMMHTIQSRSLRRLMIYQKIMHTSQSRSHHRLMIYQKMMHASQSRCRFTNLPEYDAYMTVKQFGKSFGCAPGTPPSCRHLPPATAACYSRCLPIVNLHNKGRHIDTHWHTLTHMGTH